MSSSLSEAGWGRFLGSERDYHSWLFIRPYSIIVEGGNNNTKQPVIIIINCSVLFMESRESEDGSRKNQAIGRAGLWRSGCRHRPGLSATLEVRALLQTQILPTPTS